MAREFVMGARINLNTGDYNSGMSDAIRATNRFGQGISELDNSMGRYRDSTGRLREANGRFAASAGNVTRSLEEQGGQATSLKDKMINLKSAVLGFAGIVAGKGLYDWLITSNAEMEQYQNTLSVVLGSQKKAVQTLAWANKFAAQTPFEIPQVVEATTTMASYGMNAQKTLGIVGDMASVMGKDLMQAVEAVADAQTGELERMKEFGITKGMIQEQASKMKLEPFDKKGSLQDQEALNKAMFAIMEKRFKGGMEMQAKSFKGMISNVQDFVATMGRQLGKPLFDSLKKNLQSFLVFLNNLQSSGAIDSFVNGVIKAGSLIGKAFAYSGNLLKSVFGPVVMAIVKDLQLVWKAASAIFSVFASGSANDMAKIFDVFGPAKGAQIIAFITNVKSGFKTFYSFMTGTVAPAVGQALLTIYNAVKSVAGFIIDNWSKIKPYVIGVVAAFTAYKVVMGTMAVATKIAAAAQLAFNAIMAINPVILIVLAIGLLIGWLIQLAGGWDVVKSKMLALWPVIVNAWKNIWATLQPILTMIGQKAVQIWQWLVQVVPPILATFWNLLVTWFTNIWGAISPLLTVLWTGIVNIFNSLKAFWATWGGAISGYFQVMWAFWSSIFSSALSIIWTIVQGAFTVIYNIISGAWKMISGVIQVGWALISGIFSTALNLLSGNWSGAWDSMLGMLKGVWSGIKSFFDGLKDLFFDSGVAIMKTLASGIAKMAMAPVKAVTSALGKVRKLLPFSDAKTGPLSQLTHNGGKIVSTMAEGVYKQSGTLHKAMANTLADTPSTVSGTVRANAYRVNPAGGTVSGGVSHKQQIKIDKIIVEGAGKDGKTIGYDIVAALYEKLVEADAILGADMGVLLND